MGYIGFLGPKGTFCEEAFEVLNLEKYKGKANGRDYPKIDDIIDAVYNGEIKEGVVPIENSLEGSVNLTIDLLIHTYTLKIKGEIIIPVRHHLMTKEGIDLDDIEIVISHPQALYQCNCYINNNLSNKVIIKETNSTAEAAEIVSKSKNKYAAIASETAAKIYCLQIVKKDIQIINNNFTRFIVISKEDEPFSGNDKTSLVFSVKNKPGSLYKGLGNLVEEGINLTKIESRPSKKKLGEYVFWVEIDGHREEEKLKKGIKKLKQNVEIVKILGSYPKYKYSSF